MPNQKKTSKKPVAVKKATPKKSTPKKCEITMKNFLILWTCITVMILLVVAILSFLIPKAKALNCAKTAEITEIEE